MAIFTPLTQYQNYEHVLNAMPTFVHPQNGTVYGIAIEKRGGTRQDLSVYRVRPGNPARELVHTYRGGGVDAQTQIAAGGCVIDQTGALHVWASADPVGGDPITKTGFVGGFWPPIPGVDEPWTASSTPSGTARPPVAIPPGGAIANLWPYPYTPAEVDTAQEIAPKFTKSNAALLELVRLLQEAGVLEG